MRQFHSTLFVLNMVTAWQSDNLVRALQGAGLPIEPLNLLTLEDRDNIVGEFHRYLALREGTALDMGRWFDTWMRRGVLRSPEDEVK